MTDSETPAETMRAAASLMIERADAMDAEFKTNAYRGWSGSKDAGDVYRQGVVNAMGGAGGELAAPWSPEASRAVARWLHLAAADYAAWGKDAAGHHAYALDVARHYLGEAES